MLLKSAATLLKKHSKQGVEVFFYYIYLSAI